MVLELEQPPLPQTKAVLSPSLVINTDWVESGGKPSDQLAPLSQTLKPVYIQLFVWAKTGLDNAKTARTASEKLLGIHRTDFREPIDAPSGPQITALAVDNRPQTGYFPYRPRPQRIASPNQNFPGKAD
jgi:hypothetical protein